MGLTLAQCKDRIPPLLASGPLSLHGIVAGLGGVKWDHPAAARALAALVREGVVRYSAYLRMWTVHAEMLAIAKTHVPIQKATRKEMDRGQEEGDS